ncbi:MAG TPA: dihydrofolate reductase family protein [Gemmatimonadaceae bacterium]
MAKLIYTAIASLDGFVADANGNFAWAAPDDEVHAFINDLERPIGTYLYGRRMYETMKAWEHAETFADQRPVMQDYARIWKSAEKVVYSHTLGNVSSARTRIERELDIEAVRRLKATSQRDISVGGPELAGHAIEAGLVDECGLFLTPIIVGAGTRALPSDVRVTLKLLEERRFGSGVVYVRYRIMH